MHPYNNLKELVSAAVSAIGPLRLNKRELLGLLQRKTVHDLRLHLSDALESKQAPVTMVTMFAVAIGTVLLLALLATGFFKAKRRLGLPTLQMPKGWDYPTLLQEGARRYPNSPYIITYSGYEYVVFPSSLFDEIKRLNASRASMVDWFTTVFWQGGEFLGTDNNARCHTVSTDLARALPSRVWMRQDDARAAFETTLGAPGTIKEWTEVSLWSTVQKIVALMNATGLLGPELGMDPRRLKAAQCLHTAIMVGIMGPHLTPRLLHPLVAPVVFLPAKLVDWHMQSLLRPMLQGEMKRYEEAPRSLDKKSTAPAKGFMRNSL